MKTPIIPTNFPEWKHCITVECNIPLSTDFIESRLTSLNTDSESTRQFIKLYGERHLQNILRWLQQARDEQ